MLINRTQSQVSISGLTYNNLLEDAYNAIKDSDEFKNTFSQFTSNEAARLIAELYAYMATQLATRMDQMGNELFVDTASSYGLSRLLKLVGAKIDFPAAASTDVTVSTSATTDAITFTTGIGTDKNGNDLVFLPNSFKSITANNGTSWEFIECKVGENGEYVYDYTTQYSFNAPSQTFTIHEGTTRSFNYTIRSINTDIITLPNNSVIKDSVRIYYRQKSTKPGTDNAWEIREFKKVDNFFTTTALTAKTGIYTIRNMGSGRCEICLKPYYNNETSESDIGKELLIMYRTGGGADGNIAIGSITKTERFNTLGNNGTTVTGVGELTITNIKTGRGGKDELTADEIRATVINEVRNTKIAITEEDYEYLLPKYDSDISLLKCYGEKNEETADLAETYGYYANPIAVWLIILKYNKEFYDAYMDGENGLTGRINDISFNTLDINPRFDEQYQVNSASINQVYKVNDLQNNCYDESSWQYTLEIDPRGVDVILKGNAKITVTTSPYIDSSVSSKRAEHCFDRYTGDATPIDTWSHLMELTSVQEGDVYRVAGADPDNMLNGRWKCISAISGAIDPSEYDDYWKKLDFVYLYNNFVSKTTPESTDVDDTMYIEQTGADEFTTTYSYLDGSFSASWEDLLQKYGSSGSAPITLDDITLTINGIDINFDGDEFYSLNKLAEFINDRSNPATNYVALKSNIARLSDVTDPSNVTIESAAGTTLGVPEIQLTLSGGSTVNYQVTTTGVSTYGALLDAINNALGENSPYRAVFNQNASNECWDLWIICEQQFSYKDSSTSGTSAIYRYLLNHDSYDGSAIGSQKYNLSYDQVDEWEGFIISDGDAIVEVVGTSLVLCFNDGQSTIQITGTNSGPLREAFGLSIIDDDVHTRLDNRNITVSLVTSEDSNKASVVITMSSENEKINKDVYINVFGGENEDITLGSYYANIEDNLPSDTSQTIIDLLKRKPLKSLYSTSYNTSGVSPVIDKYGCNYQLKFSTGLVGEKTYNELSSGNSPAYVDTTKASYDTLRQFSNNEYLYLKVDGIEYSGVGSFTIGNEEPITVPEEGGYAKFNLDWFNSKTVSNFAYAIVKTFEAEGFGGTPLIDYIPIDGDYIRIYTNSAAYYSSLDFGLTQANTISYLFGTNDSIVYSEEGQIDVDQITYSSLSLTSYPAIGRTMNIKYTAKNGSQEISRDVAVGYSLTSFASNLAASDINKDGEGNYVPRIVFDSNRIILADLSNTAKIKVTVQWSDQTEKNAWEKMFTDSSWGDFIIIDEYQKTEDTRIVEGKTYYTRSGSDPDYVYTPVEHPVEGELGNYYEKSSGSAYCEYTNSGDYYINLEEDEEGNNVYKLVIESPDKFPFGNIYVHMYEDYSFDHVVSDDYGIITYTDEYNWNNLMTDRRVMLTEHIYKQPRFIPFDLALTCTLPNTETFSQVDYNAELKTFLRNNYGIYSDNIGKEIRPDDIILSIKDSFSKIINVTVDYLGYDMLSDITNKTKLETKFNQQHIIASDDTSIEAVQDPDTGLITFDSVAKHGIKLTFKYS